MCYMLICYNTILLIIHHNDHEDDSDDAISYYWDIGIK